MGRMDGRMDGQTELVTCSRVIKTYLAEMLAKVKNRRHPVLPVGKTCHQ